jgi:signal peptidase II
MLAQWGESFRQPFFYAVTVVAVVIFFIFFLKLPKQARILPVAISLVFGGIAGNILDRIRFGMVTDFLSFHIQDKVLDWNIGGWHLHVPLSWPAFNVADSAITIAMLLLVISVFKTERGKHETDTF